MKEPKIEEQWDKKKILLFLFTSIIFLFIALELKAIFLPEETQVSPKTAVEGASTQIKTPDIKKNVQNEINSLKAQAQNIKIEDVASSSPQVQKVINDLKALKDYPSNQLKSACDKICSGL